jgi:hypothetical protein
MEFNLYRSQCSSEVVELKMLGVEINRDRSSPVGLSEQLAALSKHVSWLVLNRAGGKSQNIYRI